MSAAAQRLIAGLVLTGLMTSCGGAPVLPDDAPREDGIDDASGVRLMVLTRPTDGRIWLSVWLDAGTRDAPSPAVATVAAWAAASPHPEIEARVLADGIELSSACRAEALERCLGDLADVVAARAPEPAALAAAFARLRRDRGLLLADPARRADALALSALFGRSLDPFSGPEPSADEVSAFLAAHFGRDRALVIAIGDVARDDAREAVVRAFDSVPDAGLARALARPAPARNVAVEVGDASIVSVAAVRPSVADATHLGRRLSARAAVTLRGEVAADVFPIRGGAVVIVRARGQVGTVSEVLVARLSELLEEATAPPSEVRSDDDPVRLARWIGASWASDGPPATSNEPGLGLGVLVNGGRGDDLEARDPDEALREQTEREVSQHLDAAARPVELEGEVGHDGVEARLVSNGARVHVQRLPGATAAGVAIVFEGGAGEESPRVHGISAMLANVLAAQCDELAVDELGRSLGSIGAESHAILTGGSFGIALVGPRERWAELTYLAPRCAEGARLTTRSIERARLGLASVDPLLGEIALSLAPGAPGRIAPLGSEAARAGIGPDELRRWRAAHLVGGRARLGFAGDVRADVVAQRLARGAMRWRAGPAPEVAPWTDEPARLRAVHRDGGIEIVIGWIAPAAERSDAIAAGFAVAMARSLGDEPGLRVRWERSGWTNGRAWAAIALGARPDIADDLPARIRRSIAAVEGAWPAIARRALEEAREARAWSGASPRHLATSLVLDRAPLAQENDAARLLSELARSSPAIVIARPQPGLR